MKIKSIKFNNHPILKDKFFNFSDDKGKVYDTVVLAGVNGSGKTALLKFITDIEAFIRSTSAPLGDLQEYTGVISEIICIDNNNKECKLEFNGVNNKTGYYEANLTGEIEKFSKEYKEIDSSAVSIQSPRPDEDTPYGFKRTVQYVNLNNPLGSHNSIRTSSNLAEDIISLLIYIAAQDRSNLFN